MFALRFRFPGGRYHATPWGRNVNEADVAWPPEPWRLLRTLIAMYWRKGNHDLWPKETLRCLIDTLAKTPPAYLLPEGAIHAHTRHYMPQATIDKKTLKLKTTLISDAFIRLPKHAEIIVAWPGVTLNSNLFNLAADLADAIGYLGRTESWVECDAHVDWKWKDEPNCKPMETKFNGTSVRLLAPLSPADYIAERNRLIKIKQKHISSSAKKPLSETQLKVQTDKVFRNKKSGENTLPEHLVDALALDTSVWQDHGWPRPPAARELLYTLEEKAAFGVMPRQTRMHSNPNTPMSTVARFLLVGRPRPRIEDTVKIGELMRLAALSKFGWRQDDASGPRMPNAPWQISGRDANGKPLKDPAHSHAFWLPEDADMDGLIDHVSVFIANGNGNGINHDICVKLGRITRLWLESKQQTEWRLALEGFGKPAQFAGKTSIFGCSRQWQSATPFLATGHLKATGYAGEFRRLFKRTEMDKRYGFDAEDIEICELQELSVREKPRRVLHFHRFRNRGREEQRDTAGTFLKVRFPMEVEGPIALGYGSHFGLGLFTSCADN